MLLLLSGGAFSTHSYILFSYSFTRTNGPTANTKILQTHLPLTFVIRTHQCPFLLCRHERFELT